MLNELKPQSYNKLAMRVIDSADVGTSRSVYSAREMHVSSSRVNCDYDLRLFENFFKK